MNHNLKRGGGPKRQRATSDALRKRIRQALPAVLDSVLQAALAGDTTAAKILLDRGLAPLKPENEKLPRLPELVAGTDPRAALLELLAKARITPEAAATIARVLGDAEPPEAEIVIKWEGDE